MVFDNNVITNIYCAEKYNAFLNDANFCFVNQFIDFNKKITKYLWLE